jgi:hypothetical protein
MKKAGLSSILIAVTLLAVAGVEQRFRYYFL